MDDERKSKNFEKSIQQYCTEISVRFWRSNGPAGKFWGERQVCRLVFKNILAVVQVPTTSENDSNIRANIIVPVILPSPTWTQLSPWTCRSLYLPFRLPENRPQIINGHTMCCTPARTDDGRRSRARNSAPDNGRPAVVAAMTQQ